MLLAVLTPQEPVALLFHDSFPGERERAHDVGLHPVSNKQKIERLQTLVSALPSTRSVFCGLTRKESMPSAKAINACIKADASAVHNGSRYKDHKKK